ncbi:hypothetical protein GDO86_014220 [Hymenochirus boettgeri]|uniref:Uncharacterized protein n=1 Tax=Hymenochirus boettgeri TaxID=247094 RepID=A0A8T2JW60_9PIPI|nr:hypothetical protein GDO86_014220 [Hymenochirus boettgeri]
MISIPALSSQRAAYYLYGKSFVYVVYLQGNAEIDYLLLNTCKQSSLFSSVFKNLFLIMGNLNTKHGLPTGSCNLYVHGNKPIKTKCLDTVIKIKASLKNTKCFKGTRLTHYIM